MSGDWGGKVEKQNEEWKESTHNYILEESYPSLAPAERMLHQF